MLLAQLLADTGAALCSVQFRLVFHFPMQRVRLLASGTAVVGALLAIHTSCGSSDGGLLPVTNFRLPCPLSGHERDGKMLEACAHRANTTATSDKPKYNSLALLLDSSRALGVHLLLSVLMCRLHRMPVQPGRAPCLPGCCDFACS